MCIFCNKCTLEDRCSSYLWWFHTGQKVIGDDIELYESFLNFIQK